MPPGLDRLSVKMSVVAVGDGGADRGLVPRVDERARPSPAWGTCGVNWVSDPPYRNRDATKWSPGSIRV